LQDEEYHLLNNPHFYASVCVCRSVHAHLGACAWIITVKCRIIIYASYLCVLWRCSFTPQYLQYVVRRCISLGLCQPHYTLQLLQQPLDIPYKVLKRSHKTCYLLTIFYMRTGGQMIIWYYSLKKGCQHNKCNYLGHGGVSYIHNTEWYRHSQVSACSKIHSSTKKNTEQP
jgi:hypothetical protein